MRRPTELPGKHADGSKDTLEAWEVYAKERGVTSLRCLAFSLLCPLLNAVHISGIKYPTIDYVGIGTRTLTVIQDEKVGLARLPLVVLTPAATPAGPLAACHCLHAVNHQRRVQVREHIPYWRILNLPPVRFAGRTSTPARRALQTLSKLREAYSFNAVAYTFGCAGRSATNRKTLTCCAG
jgi:hypothetical protein